MLKFQGTIFADYSQILVQDFESLDNLSELWNDESVRDRLAVGSNIIGIRTARSLDVPVTIEVLQTDSDMFDVRDWDQIVECSINVNSGKLVVMGVTDYLPDAPTIDLQPSKYRLRIFYAGLDSISEDGLGGDDRYRVVMWPDAVSSGVTFVKQHRSKNETAP